MLKHLKRLKKFSVFIVLNVKIFTRISGGKNMVVDMAKTFNEVKIFFSFFNVLYLFSFNHQQILWNFGDFQSLGQV